MKLAIVGKGGVGKTTLAASLARRLERKGRPVVAVDADPDGNLASALGVPPERAPEPIVHMRELVLERTGARDEGWGLMFKLNPKVDDLPERFAVDAEGVRLLVVQPLDRERRPDGDMIIAADAVDLAGPGELVYIVASREAALAMPEPFVPVDHAIVGIVDQVART